MTKKQKTDLVALLVQAHAAALDSTAGDAAKLIDKAMAALEKFK